MRTSGKTGTILTYTATCTTRIGIDYATGDSWLEGEESRQVADGCSLSDKGFRPVLQSDLIPAGYELKKLRKGQKTWRLI